MADVDSAPVLAALTLFLLAILSLFVLATSSLVLLAAFPLLFLLVLAFFLGLGARAVFGLIGVFV